MTVYEIRNNNQYGSKEIYFDGKPEQEILKKLKELKFKWNFKKLCWYGFADERTITDAINNTIAGNQEEIKTGGVVGEGYMGGGEWTGCNVPNNKYLSYAEINKIVKKEMKRLYPKVKISTRGRSYTGGQSSDFTIFLTKEELFLPIEEIKQRYMNNYIYLKGNWKQYEDENGTIKNIHVQDIEGDIISKIMDYEINDNLNRNGTSINQYYINKNNYIYSDYALEIFNKLYAIVQSFIHDESNSMVDYFDRNLYDSYSFEVIE